MGHLQQIFAKLNLNKSNGLYITSENRWRDMFSNRVERLIDNVIEPDAFFCIDNKPFILFFENARQRNVKLKEIWNFNESPIVIFVEEDRVDIYNGFNFLTEHESLQHFGKNEKLSDFEYFKLVTGETWNKYHQDFLSTNRIDYHLLNNVKAARQILVTGEDALDVDVANSLIGKVIFVRYLIDRKVKLNFDGTSRVWSTDEFCGVLSKKRDAKKFFQYLKEKFNGDLFPIDSADFDSISIKCFSVLIRLLKGEEVSTGQISLFDLYDFSIIPVEFISNVYELFIGQREQEDQGAYYTPLFLVDYILAETIERKFQTNKKIFECKVLDPACGSGIFLVETLRKIIERYQQNNPSKSTRSKPYKEVLKRLATDNIFGIDKDKSAVNVAIFSIYLTLLDYQNPSDIETFKFPPLLNKNFFIADFFDKQAEFNRLFVDVDFDFILGNPPWKRGKGENGKPLFVKYIDERRKIESSSPIKIEISNSEIAQAFIFRVGDFSNVKTKIALIATSKILYNLYAKNFRRYLLDKFFINKVFELAPVRKEVFDKSNDKAVGPATILFYQSAENKNTDENVLEHITLKPNRFFSLFKVFTLQRSDYKKISQKQLKDHDELWKILVYGSYLDFNLIRRLNVQYAKIEHLINDESKFTVSQGIIIGSKDRNDDVSNLVGLPCLDTRTDITSFWVNRNPANKWKDRYVHRSRSGSKNIFDGPALLITGGLNNNLRSVCAISPGGLVFKSSLTAIRSEEIETLRSIAGIISSSVFAYFSLLTFSSIGIEREESHDEEKFRIPFAFNESILTAVSVLEKLRDEERNQSNGLVLRDWNLATSEAIANLDSVIVDSFAFTPSERDLLDYAMRITLPLIMRHKSGDMLFMPYEFESKELLCFAELFLKRFNEIYNRLDQELVVEIAHSNQLIGMFFKVVKKDSGGVKWTRSDNTQIIKLISSLGVKKITDKLFVQKDVRGFEQNGFYIIKPNERKLWHKAMAHVDVNEFIDAILISGKKEVVNV